MPGAPYTLDWDGKGRPGLSGGREEHFSQGPADDDAVLLCRLAHFVCLHPSFQSREREQMINLGNLVKHKLRGPIPRVSVSAGQGRGLKMCVSDGLLRLPVMGALLSEPCTGRVPSLRFRHSTLRKRKTTVLTPVGLTAQWLLTGIHSTEQDCACMVSSVFRNPRELDIVTGPIFTNKETETRRV